METGQHDPAADAVHLRAVMVRELHAAGALRTERVAAAFGRVPREVFAPGTPVGEAYGTQKALVTKRDAHGAAVSSVSAPVIQALMIEQACLAPGMRVLEVGSGGYNAALIAEVVGRDGVVTSMDIDPDVAARARWCLDAAGYAGVRVVCGDAEFGVPEDAPFDRIVVTIGVWDVAPAWWHQLAPDGRLVVPLRVAGLTRSLALERRGDHLASVSAEVCGFVRVQGAGAHEEQVVHLRDGRVRLYFDERRPQAVDNVDAHAFDTPYAETWSGVAVPRLDSLDSLQLWLATTLPTLCRLAVAPDTDVPLTAPGTRWFPLAAVLHDSVAYLVARRTPDGLAEFGAHAFGPHAATAAETFASHVHTWAQRHRDGPGPTIAVWPRTTPNDRLRDDSAEVIRVIDKVHSRITIAWG